jgi:orotate phosphoribosyltransferase
LRPFAGDLANRISGYGVDAICGPLTGGALLAGMIADRLELELLFAERRVSGRTGLFPVDYRIATALRDQVKGRRVAIVDDAVSAGSAVRATYADLVGLGGVPVLIGALLVIGPGAAAFAAEKAIPLERLADLATAIWAPTECPMCAVGAPLTNAGAV